MCMRVARGVRSRRDFDRTESMSESWLAQFECRLEQLERAAHEDGASLPEVLQRSIVAVDSIVTHASTHLYLVRSTAPLANPNNQSDAAAADTEVEEIFADGSIHAVDATQTPLVLEALNKSDILENAAGESKRKELLIGRTVTSGLTCVLNVQYEDTPASPQSLTEGARAIAEILSAAVARHLVGQYDSQLRTQAGMVHLVTRLHECQTVQQAAGVIAQEATSVLGDCRVSVLIRRSGKLTVEAITGVRQPNHDAETVRAITRVAEAHHADGWADLSDTPLDKVPGTASLHESGTRHLRLLRFRTPNRAKDAAAIVIELTETNRRPHEYILQQLHAAVVSSLIPLWQRERSLAERVVQHRGIRWFLVMVVAVLILIGWPTRFEVEVPGQIVSTNHRRIYAPERGVVDHVHFTNEKPVAKNDLLLTMSNPDIDLELRRIQSDIDTTNAELRSVAARRNSGGDADLSGQEQRLLQRANSLKLELELVASQLKSLQVRAPFGGRVFRHNPQQELEARPVQRGQLLLEIVPDDNMWHIDLSIPDEVEGYVRDAVQHSDVQRPVRYFVRASPDQFRTTSLTGLEDAVRIVDGQMICLGRAAPGDIPGSGFRPGTSVVARIDCGKRSLGFVWFREIAELWQQIEFAWL